MEKKFLEMMTYFDEYELAHLYGEGWLDMVRELQLADRLEEMVEMLEGDYEEDGEDGEEGEEDEEVE
ncbi:hypothetical protein N0V85_008062 [Neurospora sp. IMI 360204]|nr:hypothetical protein N0V85_008062 [Neurospora sp. IMI 360204]